MTINLEEIIISKVLAISGNKMPVVNVCKLREDLGLDSIKLVLLFTVLCDDLHVDLLEIDDLELLKVDTVDSLIKLFKQKIS